MIEMNVREQKQQLFNKLQDALLESRPMQATIIIEKLEKLPLSLLEKDFISNYQTIIKKMMEEGGRWNWYGESDLT